MSTKKASKRGKKSRESTQSPIEEILGTTLLKPKTDKNDAEYPTALTKDVLKDKEFVLLYFSALSPTCEFFLPFLKEFYEKHSETGKFQVVYVSSDRNLDDFDQNFSNMPWVSIPNSDEGFHIKNKLAQRLKISKIPVLITLRAQTGFFVTNKTHLEIRRLADRNFDDAASKKTIEAWKSKEAVTIEEGVQDMQIDSMLVGLLKNPIWIVVVFYVWKWFFKNKMSSADSSSDEGEL